MDSTPRLCALYRYFDTSDRLLYVGIAFDPDQRAVGHHHKDWWPLQVRRTDEWFASRQEAAEAEVRAIHAEAPIYNRWHNVEAVPLPVRKDRVRVTELRDRIGSLVEEAYYTGTATLVEDGRKRQIRAALVPYDWYRRALAALQEQGSLAALGEAGPAEKA